MNTELNSKLPLFSRLEPRPSSLTTADQFFKAMCALHGFCFGLERNFSLTVLCSLVWLVEAILSFGAIPKWMASRLSTTAKPLTPTDSGSVLKQLVCGLVMLRWKLSLILRNDDFESVLPANGRHFRDFLPIMVSSYPFLAMALAKTVRATDWLTLVHFSHTLLYLSAMMNFMLLYNDALLGILRLEADLSYTARHCADDNELIAKKWRLRDRIQTVNKLFARPLVILYSQVVPRLIGAVGQMLGRSIRLTEFVMSSLSTLCYFIQIFAFVQKGSALIKRIALFEEQILHERALCDLSDGGLDANAGAALFRLRKEWDVLKAYCFALDIPNFLRYLLFCVTIIAILLQFDYGVHRYLEHLGTEEYYRNDTQIQNLTSDV